MEQLFDVKYIDLELQTYDKFETIKYLANVMGERLLDVPKYIEDVKVREAMSTTGIGDGIAIPHAKSKWVNKPTVAVGKSRSGIPWESLDEQPAHLIFLIAVPEGDGNEHLKILQKLVINLMDDTFKETLLLTEDRSAVAEMLNQ